MQTILAYAPIVIFVLALLFFRKWSVGRDRDGHPDKTRTHLRSLQFLSWLLLVIAVVLSVVRKEDAFGPSFTLLVVGLMGIQVWQIATALMKRMEALEAESAIVAQERSTAHQDGKP